MKLYKNTFYVCLVFALITMVAAVITQRFNPAGFLLLLQNFSIGLSCSSILVIVPTYLQYRSEKTRFLKDLGSLLYDISINIVIGSCDNLTDRQYYMIADQLQNQFMALLEYQIEYTTIIPSGREKVAEKLATVLSHGIQFISIKGKESHVAAVRNLCMTEKGKEIIKITLQLAANIPCKDIFDEYLKEYE